MLAVLVAALAYALGQSRRALVLIAEGDAEPWNVASLLNLSVDVRVSVGSRDEGERLQKTGGRSVCSPTHEPAGRTQHPRREGWHGVSEG